jgi:hypothetical protein
MTTSTPRDHGERRPRWGVRLYLLGVVLYVAGFVIDLTSGDLTGWPLVVAVVGASLFLGFAVAAGWSVQRRRRADHP